MTQPFDADSYGKVAVLYGGTNSEREVSLESGTAVCRACSALAMDYIAVDIGADPVSQIQQLNVDWAFNILHGGVGENGAISSILDMRGIRYCSSSALASAVAMDKVCSKRLWRDAGLLVPDFVELRYPCEDPLAVIESHGLQLPLVVKPPSEGSSVGVSIITEVSQLQAVIERDLKEYRVLMVESFISGKEITVAILGDQALPSVHIEGLQGFYDYEAKYLSDSTRLNVPSGLTAAMERQVQSIAQQAFALLGCRTWGRIDFIVSDSNEMYLLEANTLPGMTSHSLVPRAAEEIGLSFTQLIEKIFLLSSQHYRSHEHT